MMSGVRALNLLFRYTLEVTSVDPETLGETLIADIDSQFSEVYMTGAEKLRQQGLAKGLVRVVSKQLQLRFGPLPASAQERIDQADMAELDLFIERVLSASSLDEVLS